MSSPLFPFFFFFNDTAPTEIYTLSLHDALPITQAVRAQAAALHADEPLRCGAEDDRGLVTPAMRIAVAQRLLVQESPTLGECIDDHRVGRIDLAAGHERAIGQGAPSGPHRGGH